MNLIEARTLAKETILDASAIMQTAGTEADPERVFTTPRISFDGLSPVITIEIQEMKLVIESRAMSVEPYRFDVYVLAIADLDVPDKPDTLATLAEDQLCTIVQAIIPALRTAGFEVGTADFSPRNTPWRRVDRALVYRWCQIPIVIENED